MRRTIACILLSFCTLLSTRLCRAQTPIEPPHVPAFNQLFKQPTGQNGYEDLVIAGDLLYKNAAFEAAKWHATLTERRRALADPDLRKALALLRTGLGKPIAAPAIGSDVNVLHTETFPFLDLARLLLIEQYVLLADGETARAIQSLNDGLRFGNAIRVRHMMLGDRMGMVIAGWMINQTAKHLGQFSDHDCADLLQLIGTWLEVEYSPIPALNTERDHLLDDLEQMRKNPGGTLQNLLDDENLDENSPRAKLLADANANAIAQAAVGAEAMVREQFAALAANMQLPPWQQREIKMPSGNGIANMLFETISSGYDATLERYAEGRVNLQLLAIHVAIRQYRWQYDRLPDRLEQLRQDALTIDPFTGKMLVYQRKGDDYELYSAGPERAANGDRTPGRRTPISLAQ